MPVCSSAYGIQYKGCSSLCFTPAWTWFAVLTHKARELHVNCLVGFTGVVKLQVSPSDFTVDFTTMLSVENRVWYLWWESNTTNDQDSSNQSSGPASQGNWTPWLFSSNHPTKYQSPPLGRCCLLFCRGGAQMRPSSLPTSKLTQMTPGNLPRKEMLLLS